MDSNNNNKRGDGPADGDASDGPPASKKSRPARGNEPQHQAAEARAPRRRRRPRPSAGGPLTAASTSGEVHSASAATATAGAPTAVRSKGTKSSRGSKSATTTPRATNSGFGFAFAPESSGARGLPLSGPTLARPTTSSFSSTFPAPSTSAGSRIVELSAFGMKKDGAASNEAVSCKGTKSPRGNRSATTTPRAAGFGFAFGSAPESSGGRGQPLSRPTLGGSQSPSPLHTASGRQTYRAASTEQFFCGASVPSNVYGRTLSFQRPAVATSGGVQAAARSSGAPLSTFVAAGSAGRSQTAGGATVTTTNCNTSAFGTLSFGFGPSGSSVQPPRSGVFGVDLPAASTALSPTTSAFTVPRVMSGSLTAGAATATTTNPGASVFGTVFLGRPTQFGVAGTSLGPSTSARPSGASQSAGNAGAEGSRSVPASVVLSRLDAPRGLQERMAVFERQNITVEQQRAVVNVRRWLNILITMAAEEPSPAETTASAHPVTRDSDPRPPDP